MGRGLDLANAYREYAGFAPRPSSGEDLAAEHSSATQAEANWAATQYEEDEWNGNAIGNVSAAGERANAWRELTGSLAKRRASPHSYDALVMLATTSDAPEMVECRNQIDKDVPRTFPENPLFRETTHDGVLGLHQNEQQQGQLLEPLRRVLSAYCMRDRRVGYCQAMNFVAATLLLVLEEDDAFWVLCCLIEDIVPGYYTKDMFNLRVDLRTLDRFAQTLVPRVHAKLEQLALPLELPAMRWFLSLFTSVFDTPMALHILDELFAVVPPLCCARRDGLSALCASQYVADSAVGLNIALQWQGNKVLFQVSVGFLQHVESLLLSCTQPEEALDVMNAKEPTVHGFRARFKFTNLPLLGLDAIRSSCSAQLAATQLSTGALTPTPPMFNVLLPPEGAPPLAAPPTFSQLAGGMELPHAPQPDGNRVVTVCVSRARGLAAKQVAPEELKTYACVSVLAAGDARRVPPEAHRLLREPQDMRCTKVVAGGTEPVWNARLSLPADGSARELVVTVYHEIRAVGAADEALGQVVVPLREGSSVNDQWFVLTSTAAAADAAAVAGTRALLQLKATYLRAPNPPAIDLPTGVVRLTPLRNVGNDRVDGLCNDGADLRNTPLQTSISNSADGTKSQAAGMVPGLQAPGRNCQLQARSGPQDAAGGAGEKPVNLSSNNRTLEQGKSVQASFPALAADQKHRPGQPPAQLSAQQIPATLSWYGRYKLRRRQAREEKARQRAEKLEALRARAAVKPSAMTLSLPRNPSRAPPTPVQALPATHATSQPMQLSPHWHSTVVSLQQRAAPEATLRMVTPAMGAGVAALDKEERAVAAEAQALHRRAQALAARAETIKERKRGAQDNRSVPAPSAKVSYGSWLTSLRLRPSGEASAGKQAGPRSSVPKANDLTAPALLPERRAVLVSTRAAPVPAYLEAGATFATRLPRPHFGENIYHAVPPRESSLPWHGSVRHEAPMHPIRLGTQSGYNTPVARSGAASGAMSPSNLSAVSAPTPRIPSHLWSSHDQLPFPPGFDPSRPWLANSQAGMVTRAIVGHVLPAPIEPATATFALVPPFPQQTKMVGSGVPSPARLLRSATFSVYTQESHVRANAVPAPLQDVVIQPSLRPSQGLPQGRVPVSMPRVLVEDSHFQASQVCPPL